MIVRPVDLETDIAAAKAGNDYALGLLLERFRARLTFEAQRQLNPSLRTKADETDLVQEVLVIALKRFPNFRGDTTGEFAAWLTGILTHRRQKLERRFCATAKRDVARERRLTKTIREKLQHNEAPATEREEQRERLRRAYAHLSLEDRLLVRLHYHEQLTFKEIAPLLGRTVGAVKKHWTRVLERLGKKVGVSEHERARPKQGM